MYHYNYKEELFHNSMLYICNQIVTAISTFLPSYVAGQLQDKSLHFIYLFMTMHILDIEGKLVDPV